MVAAFTPIHKLEEMVNIGTLMAFVDRLRRGADAAHPAARRAAAVPLPAALYVVAPLGILVNLIMMLFLPLDTWLRLVVWLVIGLVHLLRLRHVAQHAWAGQLREPDRRTASCVDGPPCRRRR